MAELTRPQPQESVNSRPDASSDICANRRTRPASHPRYAKVIFAILFGTLFLLAHPYRGIWHDAILYTAQALENANPKHFRHDLFFQFGSQDDWSLYGETYQRLIGMIGIRASNLLGLVAAQGLWWSGMWRLSKRFLPAPWNWICLLLIASMPTDYGDEFVFSYDEFFLSARLPAEALSLWAFAFVLEHRRIPAIATALIAMAIHPLIGAVGFATVLICMIPRAPWWRIFAAILPLFAIAQFLTPSSFAIHPFDSEWQHVVRSELQFLFPSQWYLFSWSKACWVIALPLILAAVETTERRLMWRGLALMGVAGISFSALADIAGHDAFWIQVQSWRVLWLLSVMQWVAITTLLSREWRNRPGLIWLLVICWLQLELGGGGFVALALAALAHIESFKNARGKSAGFFKELTRPYKVCLVAAALGATVLGIIFQTLYHRALGVRWPGTINVNVPWLEAVIHTRLMVVLVGVLSTAYLFRARLPRAVLYLLLVSLASLAGYAFVNIDQRASTAKIMEADLDAPERAPFARQVSAGQMVYWDGPPDEIVYPWLLMKTSSYFSPVQASGMVFHRETTFEALHRLSTIAPNNNVGSSEHPYAYPGKLFPDPASFKPLTSGGIIRVCRAPDLDLVVSPLHYPVLSTNDEWAPNQQSKYWLYDCKRINSMPVSSLPKNQ